MYLREGAIYKDRFNNIIQLRSIGDGYCTYGYVIVANSRCQAYGSVTGLTRRNVFDSEFVFVAECVEDWIGNQLKNSQRWAHAFSISVPAAQEMLGRFNQRIGLTGFGDALHGSQGSRNTSDRRVTLRIASGRLPRSVQRLKVMAPEDRRCSSGADRGGELRTVRRG